MKSLNDAVCALEFVDKRTFLAAVLVRYNEFSLCSLFNTKLCILVNIAVSVTCDSDRLCPCRDIGCDALNDDRCAENRTVKDSSDSSVRRLPHFFKVVFGHTGSIWSNGCALYSNAVLLCSLCGINSYLIIGSVSVFKSEVIVFGVEVNIRKDKDFLYHLPDNSGHLVAVHFDERSSHFDFFSHFLSLLY